MTESPAIQAAIGALHRPLFLRETNGHYVVVEDSGEWGAAVSPPTRTAYAPPYRLEDLGDPTFCADHRLRYPYVTGAMANGIGSADIVEAMSRAGMLGFFGAAGLPLPVVEAAIQRIQRNLGDQPYGFNFIHTPQEPDLEGAVADLYLRHGVRLAEASAFLDLTPSIVRYRLHGIHQAPDGTIVTPNRVIAKVSRVEVASKFFAPAPERLLQELVRRGALSEQQVPLAQRVPVAQDVTVEADSGGHTDNRPAITLLPTIVALRDRMREKHDLVQPIRVGAAGGIATPASAAAAFAMGAAYVLTGSINQACVESGSSDLVREMLAQAEQADTAMAPAADMFEMGVRVQVLKRGTMFPMRAAKLYDLYRTYNCLEELPESERAPLEKNLFRAPLADIWEQTRIFFTKRDPRQIERADKDPKHKMALVFRWYLGQSSRWANAGEPTRRMDYQVWCGPAMGAFNEWARGSFLEQPKNRRVVTVALNLLYAAGVLLRLCTLRCQGLPIPPEWSRLPPLELERLEEVVSSQ